MRSLTLADPESKEDKPSASSLNSTEALLSVSNALYSLCRGMGEVEGGGAGQAEGLHQVWGDHRWKNSYSARRPPSPMPFITSMN